MRRTLRLGNEVARVGNKRIRSMHFRNEANVPIAASCLVANTLRERLVQLLGERTRVICAEPAIPARADWDVLAKNAALFTVTAAQSEMVLILPHAAVVALLSSAFGATDLAITRKLSPIEAQTLERLAGEIALAATPIFGAVSQVRSVGVGRDLTGALVYLEFRVFGARNFRLGFALAQDTADVRGPKMPPNALQNVPIDVRAIVGTIDFDLGRLIGLEIGALLPMSKREEGTAELRSGTSVIARGNCGVAGNRSAFLITQAGEKQSG